MKYIRHKNLHIILTVYIYLIQSSLQARLTVPKRAMLHNFVRCTRRYTPGMCIEPVGPVWTFAFQMQNCTERYGCPTEWRSNRFESYDRCIRRCKPLADLYTEILAHDPHNLSVYLRSKNWAPSGRRENDMEEYHEGVENDDEIIIDSLEGPAPNILEDDSDLDYRDSIPDIDYVDLDIMQDDRMYH